MNWGYDRLGEISAMRQHGKDSASFHHSLHPVSEAQTHAGGGGDGVGAGDEGLAVVQADEDVHGPEKKNVLNVPCELVTQ